MKDLLEAIFTLPLAMARVGVQQLQSFIDQNKHTRLPWDAKSSRRDLHDMDDFLANKHEAEFNDPVHLPWPDRNALNVSAGPMVGNTLHLHPVQVEHASPAFVSPRLQDFDMGRLDVSTMVVVGDTLTAGAGDFCISATSQPYSFPALLAKRVRAEYHQALIEPPGIPLTQSSNQCRPPLLSQSSVTNDQFVNRGDFSIPGIYLHNSLRLRPSSPVFQQNNPRQTLVNLVLGGDSADKQHLATSTQIECAAARHPTFAIFAVGFSQVLDAALAGRPEKLPELATLESDLLTALKRLTQGTTELLLCNVPNPLDTAAFSGLQSAATYLRVPASWLKSRYGLTDNDHITTAGLIEIGSQVLSKQHRPLAEGYVLAGRQADQLSSFVEQLNDLILRTAERHQEVHHCDIAAWYRRVAENGIDAGNRRLSSDYLGGIYGLNGYTIGFVGQALLCNHVISSINESFDAHIPEVDINELLAIDPVLKMRPPTGRSWTAEELEFPATAKNSVTGTTIAPKSDYLHRTFSQIEKEYVRSFLDPPLQPLQLPHGLEQVLPLNSFRSYHCDAMRVVNCRNASEVQWGTCSDDVFDGLAIFGGALHGHLHIRFSPPIANETSFEIRILDRLHANEGVLSTPGFFSFPLQSAEVTQPPGMLCTGRLNVATGEVSQLTCPLVFQNSGLVALQQMNPRAFPTPAVIQFKQGIPPTEGYGTAFARFTQRPDGKLDFAFHGTAFVPMGPGFVFVLPIAGPDGQYATVPANGTQLHPQIHLNTQEKHTDDLESNSLETNSWIPEDRCLELAVDTSRTSFGDDFTLNHPDLGFAEGRSHLTGRLLIQFGRRFGDLVPFAVRLLPPAGNCDSPNLFPLQAAFPGRLCPGLIGHDSVLRFSARQYRQNDLFLLDDPFDIPIGAVNIYTGEVIGDFMHRGLLGQALFYALVRVEPRTPQGSFEYRGIARFSKGANSQLCFQFSGTVYLPYQAGFLWPLPDLANGIAIGPDSRLDPFFQVVATQDNSALQTTKSGSARLLTAPTGEEFSFKYRISNKPGEKVGFEYTNHSQNGTFVLERLIAVDFLDNTQGDGKRATIVTFSCWGRWSKDIGKKRRLGTVQVSADPKRPYVSILIDGGRVSSVNLLPGSEQEPLSALTMRRMSKQPYEPSS